MPSLDAIVRDTQSHVRSYIAALGVALHDVDDIAQEVYFAYAQQYDRAPVGVEPIRWLKGIARNLANNYFRRQARHGQAMGQLSEVLEAAPVWLPDIAADEQNMALDRCLQALSQEHQAILRRYYGQEEAAGTLAVAFSRSVDGIRRLVMRLRRDVRACVEKGLTATP